jgi:hypothetical protein
MSEVDQTTPEEEHERVMRALLQWQLVERHPMIGAYRITARGKPMAIMVARMLAEELWQDPNQVVRARADVVH